MDGSDTNAYGEPCEHGHGYTEAVGWWNPDDELWTVNPDRDHAQPDLYPAGEGTSPARWLADQLTERLGPIDHFDGQRTFYGADELGRDSNTAPPWSMWGGAFRDPRRARPIGAQSLTAAGHAHGFSTDEIATAARLLGLQPPAQSSDSPAPQRSAAPQARGFVALHDPPPPPPAEPIGIPDRSTTSPPATDRPGRRPR